MYADKLSSTTTTPAIGHGYRALRHLPHQRAPLKSALLSITTSKLFCDQAGRRTTPLSAATSSRVYVCFCPRIASTNRSCDLISYHTPQAWDRKFVSGPLRRPSAILSQTLLLLSRRQRRRCALRCRAAKLPFVAHSSLRLQRCTRHGVV